ncbi:PTS sugar transporter subunit IIA [Paenibacillus beijingensis]|uniref:PTS fructose transporter subunit IIA n=1 Tax=Paenibacillus beijingensis TaxID=1126833 RepID=A0A0D5NG74_9BACL|nr:fructose PTS transporter subunit IIA [Paenibacillus beijingensis]AJY74110.1 PTS fructose transporter subunit IIA [Paenibacillus beijingensis]
MNITSLLNDQSILIPLDVNDKNAAIDALAGALAESGAVTDKAAYLEALHARENTGSTGIGFGVAIPHGKSSGVAQAALAFAKFASPIDWQSLDGEPVSAAFMIAVPEEAAGNDHLKILIAISRKLIDDEFREQLLAVEDSAQLKELLGAI